MIRGKDSTVIRISKANYNRLKKMADGKTYNELMGYALDLMESDISYLANGKLFTDVKEARGESIKDYVVTGEMKAPLVVMVLGEEKNGF